MHTDTARRTIVFVNIAHALDHFILLIYPTAVIAIAADTGLSYAHLISQATGAFVAFGLFSLPAGWLADRYGRRNLLAVFFVGSGVAALGLATAGTATAFAGWLLVLGLFAALYHPIGSAMLVTHARRLGRDLGWNGVWGNLGAAMAAGVTALTATHLGWRTAFILPGLVCLAMGAAYLALVPDTREGAAARKPQPPAIAVSRPLALLLVFAVAIMAGGMTFNITTITLPKVLDERLGFALPLAFTGSLATVVFIAGAMTQLLMGRLIDRFSLPALFIVLAIAQALGLTMAAMTQGLMLLAGFTLTMAAIYGQVVINDAMVARYVPAHFRARAFGTKYFLGFSASGLAVPMIAWLHGAGGFPQVLAVAAGFAVVVVLAALAFQGLLLYSALADGRSGYQPLPSRASR